MGLEYALISLPELSASAVAQVSSLALEKNITVVNEVGTELPLLNADASKLKRVLVNLLGNAVKFTSPAGFVTLSARLNDDHDSVEFCVQDTGEGIPAEAFERIFQKFGQVDSRAGGRSMSTGLGLTFCKLAVEAHGGQIHVESVLLEGSKFFFTIPVSAPRRIAAA
jgi:signal transduction histidine kinase